MIRVWCLDPGQTTGVALFSLDDQTLTFVNSEDIVLWEGLDERILPGDRIVYENIIARHPSFNPIGIEVIGVIKFLARLRDCPLVRQSPTMITGVQKWPIFQWKHIKSPHQRDAISHGIVYAKSQRLTLILPEKFKTLST